MCRPSAAHCSVETKEATENSACANQRGMHNHVNGEYDTQGVECRAEGVLSPLEYSAAQRRDSSSGPPTAAAQLLVNLAPVLEAASQRSQSGSVLWKSRAESDEWGDVP